MASTLAAMRSSSHSSSRHVRTPTPSNRRRPSSTVVGRRSGGFISSIHASRQPKLPTVPPGSTLSLIRWADPAGVPPPTLGRVGVSVDTTGDGIADSTGYDTTGDGIVDALDTNGDGQIDTAVIIGTSVSAPHPASGIISSGQHAHLPLDDCWTDEDEAAWVESCAQQIYSIIDADGDGQISKLELLAAIVRNQTVDDFVLPGVDCSRALTNEQSFEEVSAIFDVIGGGKKRIAREDFIGYFLKFRSRKVEGDEDEKRLRSIFDLIDADGNGGFSNFDFLGALQCFPSVASLLLPGAERRRVLQDEKTFDDANAVWDGMAKGRRRVNFSDFVAYTNRSNATQSLSSQDVQPQQHTPINSKFPLTSAWRKQRKQCNDEDGETHAPTDGKLDDGPWPTLLHSLRHLNDTPGNKPARYQHEKPRHDQKLLIISPGFGRDLNPAQAAMVRQAGFQVQYVDVPNPEQFGFLMFDYLPYVQDAIEKFQPDVLVSASKGNAYVLVLWQRRLWKGPVLMLNVPPHLTQLPKDTTVVLAHGSNDELYKWSRTDLERLAATGSENRCYLYYTANSGHFSGGFSRLGDMHNMASLLLYDCLPRLIDAALCAHGPETHMICSWRQRLNPERNAAEQWLTHCPEQLRKLWVSKDRMGMDARKLFEVSRRSEEFSKVTTIFKAAPAEPAAYVSTNNRQWERTSILRVDRIENGLLEQSENAYYECLRKATEDQGLAFEGGVHSRWAFHGTDQVESIVEDPLTGFQPLACGTRLGSLWGSGTYFARDARYVVEGNFCPEAKDGTRQMLLCLLMTGLPCLGDPQHHGVLPFRRKPHRFNSSVDSLSSPEIFITQHPGAAYPAYLITFI